MQDGQWDLDGRVQWSGPGAKVRASSVDFGAPDVRDQDSVHPSMDGVQPGRDRKGGATHTFDFFTTRMDVEEAMAALGEIAAAWEDSRTLPPAEMSALTYAFAGRTRVMYGRGRRWAGPFPNSLAQVGRATATAQFRQLDPNTYSAEWKSLSLQLAPTAESGATWPVTWPVTWGRTSTTRQGLVSVGGNRPTPFVIEVSGPTGTNSATDISLSGDGWAMDFDLTLQYDQVLRVDTRAMTATVNGRRITSSLSRRTRLNARLQPGQQDITFSASDSTNTTTATIKWQAAHSGL